MERMISGFVLITIIFFVGGCAKTGYVVIMETDQLRYDDLRQIETTLKDKGFKASWQERPVQANRYPGEVYSRFMKPLSDKPYYWVEVYLFYVKEIQNNLARYPRIDIGNADKGLVIPEVRIEIDYITDLVYKELSDKAGKDKVRVERKETGPLLIY